VKLSSPVCLMKASETVGAVVSMGMVSMRVCVSVGRASKTAIPSTYVLPVGALPVTVSVLATAGSVPTERGGKMARPEASVTMLPKTVDPSLRLMVAPLMGLPVWSRAVTDRLKDRSRQRASVTMRRLTLSPNVTVMVPLHPGSQACGLCRGRRLPLGRRPPAGRSHSRPSLRRLIH
jgi:hypothetical protein